MALGNFSNLKKTSAVPLQEKSGKVRKAGRPRKANMVYQQLRFPIEMVNEASECARLEGYGKSEFARFGMRLAIDFVKRKHSNLLSEGEFLASIEKSMKDVVAGRTLTEAEMDARYGL